VPAGLYSVQLSFTPPALFPNRAKFQAARAPSVEWKVRVE
jgi:hypothetical protein